MAKKTNKKQQPQSAEGFKVITVNRKAGFQYHLLEKFEAGIVLNGDEIKSIREGGASLGEAYIRPYGGELWLLGAHIAEYSHSSRTDYDPVRRRKLLMHRHEIEKLQGRVEQKGLTIVPVRLYLKRGKAKLELALAKGKDNPDKRKSIQDRQKKREAERAMKQAK